MSKSNPIVLESNASRVYCRTDEDLFPTDMNAERIGVTLSWYVCLTALKEDGICGCLLRFDLFVDLRLFDLIFRNQVRRIDAVLVEVHKQPRIANECFV